MDDVNINEARELERNLQLKKDLEREVRSFQSKYYAELSAIGKENMIGSCGQKIKVSRKKIILNRINTFIDRIINCL